MGAFVVLLGTSSVMVGFLADRARTQLAPVRLGGSLVGDVDADPPRRVVGKVVDPLQGYQIVFPVPAVVMIVGGIVAAVVVNPERDARGFGLLADTWL
ncbi:hypothetical protein AXA44_21920 [Rhodococcus sp. SC4]|nr:hypothetical protein AXA44_21920 [Rhodococcus sp. SC4]